MNDTPISPEHDVRSIQEVTSPRIGHRELAESLEKYRTLFDSIDEGFCTIEVLFDINGAPFDYRILETNSAFVRLTGIENGIGRTMREIAPEHEQFWFETYGKIARTGEAVRFEHVSAALTPPRYYEVYAFRLGAPELNQVATLFNDITLRKHIEGNLAVLAEVSEDLAHLTNIEETMSRLGVRIGTHFNASICAFGEVEAQHEVVTIAHEWKRAATPSWLGSHRIDQFHTEDFRRACRSGTTYVVFDAVNDVRTNAEQMSALSVGSFVSVPLSRDGEHQMSNGQSENGNNK